MMSQEKKDDEEFLKGPLSVLSHSVKSNTQVLINVRNNKKLLGRVKAFDRHCNMVLENVCPSSPPPLLPSSPPPLLPSSPPPLLPLLPPPLPSTLAISNTIVINNACQQAPTVSYHQHWQHWQHCQHCQHCQH